MRTRRRPRLEAPDRSFWVALRWTWGSWTDALVLVKPETVVAWHRKLARRHWKLMSRGPGRPRIDRGVRGLIVRKTAENLTWGAPRIHGELRALGFDVSERTVSRYLPRIRPPRSVLSTWKTFLRTHREAIAAMDFFTVTTATLRILHVFFVIHHRRREVLHVNVTAHPTAERATPKRLARLGSGFRWGPDDSDRLGDLPPGGEMMELPRFRGHLSVWEGRDFLSSSSLIHERGFGGRAPEFL